jgi:pilus assembly protein CpaB
MGPDSYRFQPWPKELVEGAYYEKGKADMTSLNGTVVRSPMTAGQPLTQGALVKPGDRGFLAAALGAGMRAITIKTSSQHGVAGFIFPGDRVDLLLTQTVPGETASINVSETILRNVRVLATDQRTVSRDEKGSQIVKVFNTVTLEVTPKIAEKVVVAQSMGKITLSLRSIADNSADLERAIAAGEVTVPAGSDPKAERAMLAASAARPLDSGTTFQTGSDVSRFKTRSAPLSAKPIAKRAEEAGEAYMRGAMRGAGASGRNTNAAAPAPAKPKATVFVWRAGQRQEIEIGGN